MTLQPIPSRTCPLEPLAPSPLPASLAPFADPLGLDTSLEEVLHQAATLLCRWMGRASSHPPLPGLSVLPAVEPEREGLPPDRLLADLQLVMEGAYQPAHPGALAHLDPPPLTASVVADMIAAGLNNNLLADELSPSLRRLERSLCGLIAQRLGLPAGAGGVPASGGSLSNLMALVTAREQRCPGAGPEAVVLASADAHVSLDKAVRVMGLPPPALHRLPVDDDGRMDIEALEGQVTRLRRQGTPIIAVVATAGTTVRGAVDPLLPVARLCRAHDLWLHVDAAIGGAFALVPRHRSRLAGLGAADSITFNPQKVIGITKTSSLLLVADPSTLQATFATGLPYMEPSWEGGHGGEEGLQGTRPAEILKLWLGLRQLGWDGVDHLLEGALRRRRQLVALLAPDARLLLRAGPLHLLAFRPRDLDPEACARWSQLTRQRLLEHRLMLSRPCYQGHHHLKAVLGNPHTRSGHLEQLAQLTLASLNTF
ncbi:MAG: aspartate aminotransferase family protein [Cyanobacteria bacterium K_Offshore_surface_m2_239]|nr:aspartate aminotransferase family protein [Cyanobacteria bacterium K_Offshore_surface_m2_239]